MTARRLGTTLCRKMSAAPTRSADVVAGKSFVTCSNGSNIFTKVWGQPSSDRKALALHGYLDNSGSFDLLGPALAKA
ncbi:unnamed protein product, partial [Ectocarpus sp. 6 AP-2014]